MQGMGDKGKGGRRKRHNITMEELRQLFPLPRSQAAAMLQMSDNCLKRWCRKLGISRWPYRKIASLDALSQALAAEDNTENEALLQAVAQERAKVLQCPDAPLDDDLLLVRSSTYKDRHVRAGAGRGRSTARRPGAGRGRAGRGAGGDGDDETTETDDPGGGGGEGGSSSDEDLPASAAAAAAAGWSRRAAQPKRQATAAAAKGGPHTGPMSGQSSVPPSSGELAAHTSLTQVLVGLPEFRAGPAPAAPSLPMPPPQLPPQQQGMVGVGEGAALPSWQQPAAPLPALPPWSNIVQPAREEGGFVRLVTLLEQQERSRELLQQQQQQQPTMGPPPQLPARADAASMAARPLSELGHIAFASAPAAYGGAVMPSRPMMHPGAFGEFASPGACMMDGSWDGKFLDGSSGRLPATAPLWANNPHTGPGSGYMMDAAQHVHISAPVCFPGPQFPGVAPPGSQRQWQAEQLQQQQAMLRHLRLGDAQRGSVSSVGLSIGSASAEELRALPSILNLPPPVVSPAAARPPAAASADQLPRLVGPFPGVAADLGARTDPGCVTVAGPHLGLRSQLLQQVEGMLNTRTSTPALHFPPSTPSSLVLGDEPLVPEGWGGQCGAGPVAAGGGELPAAGPRAPVVLSPGARPPGASPPAAAAAGPGSSLQAELDMMLDSLQSLPSMLATQDAMLVSLPDFTEQL